jgi:hypothetical protein
LLREFHSLPERFQFISSVNTMASNLTTQVRGLAQISAAANSLRHFSRYPLAVTTGPPIDMCLNISNNSALSHAFPLFR